MCEIILIFIVVGRVMCLISSTETTGTAPSCVDAAFAFEKETRSACPSSYHPSP